MLAIATSCLAAASPRAPHILFNVIDDLGHNDLGYSDQFDQIQSPKVDALAAASVKLSDYYVYRFCSPSRSTFMTGRYPWHIGQQTEMNLNPMPGVACGISLEYTFLPRLLKERAGYRTWALGKWHLGFLNRSYTPTGRGFDRFLGYYSGAEEHFTHEKVGYPPAPGTQGGFTAYDLANSSEALVSPCLEPVGNGSATYSTFLYANEALRLLAAHDPSVPLYIYLAWNNVHSPNEAPQSYVDRHAHIRNSGRRNLSAMVSALDDSIDAVVAAFKAKGMWDHTLFVLTTDNGGNLGGSGINYPLRGGKYTFWQGGVRGIGFVGGGLIPRHMRGSSYAGAVHQADWYATIAGLAGISDPSEGTGPRRVDGVDVWHALSTNGTSPRTEVPLQIMSAASGNAYSLPPTDWCEAVRGRSEAELCTPPVAEGGADSRQGLQLGVLIRGRWKILAGYPGWSKGWDGWIRPPTDETIGDESSAFPRTPYNGTLCVKTPCLYDIEADPYEKNDVAAAHPKVVASMKARLFELQASEVTLAESGLCPTSVGTKPDPRGTAEAMATGFWQPWLDAY